MREVLAQGEQRLMELGPLPPMVVLGTGRATAQRGPPRQAPSPGENRLALTAHAMLGGPLRPIPSKGLFYFSLAFLKKKKKIQIPNSVVIITYNLQMGNGASKCIGSESHG